MAEAVAKPGVTEPIYFYDPELIKKVGFSTGYGMRGAGPYAGLVVNDNRPVDELDIYVFYPDLQPAFVREKVKCKPETGEPTKPYWDFVNPAQKMRAVKKFEDKKRAQEAADAAALAAG